MKSSQMFNKLNHIFGNKISTKLLIYFTTLEQAFSRSRPFGFFYSEDLTEKPRYACTNKRD